MGLFISSIDLTLQQIIDATIQSIVTPSIATPDLVLIAAALEPGDAKPVFAHSPDDDPGLDIDVNNAIEAANDQSVSLFQRMYGDNNIGMVQTCCGSVLNYAPQSNDPASLTAQIIACITTWGLQQPTLADSLAELIQPQVAGAGFVPSCTYGAALVLSAGNVTGAHYLFWTAAFGVFHTGGANPDNTPNLAVVFGFSAANGTM